MKLTCDRGALVEALNLAGAVAITRTPKPILECLRLKSSDGQLTVAATDMEVAVHLTVSQVELLEEGQVIVPAAKIAAIVRESSDQSLALESEDEHLHIRGADSHFKIYGYPADEFPTVEKFTGCGAIQVNAGYLHGLIQKTLFATARENSRYAINGVLVEREGKRLSLVATDGRRLALARGSCSGEGDPFSAIVPTKALNLLTRLFDDPAETVQVAIEKDLAHFATESATLTTKLVEGNFPPYKDVIPSEQDRKAVFKTDLLASAVRRAAVLTSDETRGVRMTFSEDGLQLSSQAPEMGEAQVNVPVESFSGQPLEIGFNPQFLIDVLKVVDDETVTIEMKAPNKPGVIKTGPDFIYVVMPVSLT